MDNEADDVGKGDDKDEEDVVEVEEEDKGRDEGNRGPTVVK